MNVVEVLALTGGVGGAKLAVGLAHHVYGPSLACVVNTGDDFEHLGLNISPDVDTLLYTLAGLAHPEHGWGRRDETWTFMRVLGELGGPAWFRLGDGDLALHIERTRRLKTGETLTEVTAAIAEKLGVDTCVLPMSDDPVRTRIHSDAGLLDFQDYFVGRRAEPRVLDIEYTRGKATSYSPSVAAALNSPRLRAIVLCPSNPWLSIDPMLALPGFRERLRASQVPIVAVCPLIGGHAVKGPTAKIMRELGIAPDPRAIALHYGDLIDGLVLDVADAQWANRCGVATRVTQTLMQTMEDRRTLGSEVLRFCASLGTCR
jgi:LPPG:FO 2-phospho-L-lactate transferase